ncbi:MAG: translation elongation factor 4 [Candidatus Aminicenantes bacterium]|nr:translation elongation factor 4 [Candidatus Aminicenantes bacterium]MDH5714758.1 translation elongation factor 4 [Candidatus Aminicenantes bacterium]
MATQRELIRNFSIIAHIDHGKSTLADRLLEHTGALDPREMVDQVLDDMELERERGITIKAHAVRLNYKVDDGRSYVLNLIDTPGHVDFTYEVSRSLAACEGGLLVVDAAQGVEAQTLANTYLAVETNLVLIPVINKIDLPNANVERVKEQLENIIGLEGREVLLISAKEGIGIEKVLQAIVTQIPPPRGSYEDPLKALLFDSWYDSYHGVVLLVRLMGGGVIPGMKIRLMSNEQVYEVEQVGFFTPKMVPAKELSVGDVGWITAGIKRLRDTRIGDTITEHHRPTAQPLPGLKEVKPMVFCGLYPLQSAQYGALRDAIEKLRLNDSSFSYEPEISEALGYGFRCGFLGLLHMEIIQQRLEREFDLELLTTAPGVKYRVTTKEQKAKEIDTPSKLPPPQQIAKIEEPYITATIISDDQYIGAIIQLAEERRGIQTGLEYLSAKRVLITYELPLNEVIFDFYDKLKSVSRGYASLDYHYAGYRDSDLVRLDILINGQKVDALSMIIHHSKAYTRGKALIEKLRELIPRQLFEVVIQAAIGSRVIARERIPPIRKNVLAKCYGGDVTRKRKLLERQKEGKRRLKRVGKVDIPPEAFLAVLTAEGRKG